MPFWVDVYTKAFGTIVGDHRHDEDLERQWLGVDRVLVIANGNRVVRIDEKYRTVDYGDVLLEYISNDSNNSQGWVVKSMLCDWIAYAVLPAGVCYMLPVDPLQQAWRSNRSSWLSRYKTVRARNEVATPGFKPASSLSCCVPTNVLLNELPDAKVIRFDPVNLHKDITK